MACTTSILITPRIGFCAVTPGDSPAPNRSLLDTIGGTERDSASASAGRHSPQALRPGNDGTAEHLPFSRGSAAGGGGQQWAPFANGHTAGGFSSGLSSGYSSAAHSRSGSWNSGRGRDIFGLNTAASGGSGGLGNGGGSGGLTTLSDQQQLQLGKRESVATRSLDMPKQCKSATSPVCGR